MPTAIIKPISLSTTSGTGLSLTENIYTINTSGLIVEWPNVTGIRYAEYNTDATTVLPANATVTHWKVRYVAARTASVTNVFQYVRYSPSAGGITVSDWVVTTGWTTYVYPDPGGAFPDGFPLSSVNAPSDFSKFRIGGNNTVSGSGAAYLYFDYFEVEVIYTVPATASTPTLFMNENF